MDLVKWQDSYSIGIASIDSQHRGLVSGINKLYREMSLGKGPEVLGPLMADLMDQLARHFAYEEELFLRFGYPEAERHAREHEEITAKVSGYAGSVNLVSRISAMTVANCLKEWIHDHTVGEDQKYSAFLKAEGVV
jgi:hemerythrin-like metal-binding protein